MMGVRQEGEVCLNGALTRPESASEARPVDLALVRRRRRMPLRPSSRARTPLQHDHVPAVPIAGTTAQDHSMASSDDDDVVLCVPAQLLSPDGLGSSPTDRRPLARVIPPAPLPAPLPSRPAKPPVVQLRALRPRAERQPVILPRTTHRSSSATRRTTTTTRFRSSRRSLHRGRRVPPRGKRSRHLLDV